MDYPILKMVGFLEPTVTLTGKIWKIWDIINAKMYKKRTPQAPNRSLPKGAC